MPFRSRLQRRSIADPRLDRPHRALCGSGCPEVMRVLPFSGTYHVAVGAATGDSCAGGGYRLVVPSPSAAMPPLIDNVDASTVFPP